ncbi:hypothetical protein C5167_033514 [Papaver somniferum]|uniref:Exonuclease V n=1 Tax=Papaver somniferum TaxID=3469 RepID=A0A4Y7KDG7_PAPSO|nr:exonuclease V, chloroplastic-like isoform X2 [Papaver somniferum]RZC70392.1 hypothetical protein C5167_033514 [Papaver somniferum]
MTEPIPPNSSPPPLIPIEIISEEEMTLIEAAFAATTKYLSSRSSSSSTCQIQRNGKSVETITLHTKRRLSGCSESDKNITSTDIEDLVDNSKNAQKKPKVFETFLHRFRRKRGLAITDITATEWCEKQMEFVLLRGKPKATRAMKAGTARHTKLEEEVIKRVEVRVEAAEDAWAVRLMNFIAGTNQLMFQGLTRELPVIGCVQGVWMVGVIDEIRMPVTDTSRNPIFVDTKTRVRPTLPSGPQTRNGRLQLMCYKYIWDSLVKDNFNARSFLSFFGLNPRYTLSEEIQQHTSSSGFPAKTLEDLLAYFRNTCSVLPLANELLLLRYEFQGDQSLLGEDNFTYDHAWLTGQIKYCLEFWLGERAAGFVPQEERWKCRSCEFASVCSSYAAADSRSIYRGDQVGTISPSI